MYKNLVPTVTGQGP